MSGRLGALVGLIVMTLLVGGFLIWLQPEEAVDVSPMERGVAESARSMVLPEGSLPVVAGDREAQPLESASRSPSLDPADQGSDLAPSMEAGDTNLLRVSGRVVDESARPIAGAEVMLHLSRRTRMRLDLTIHYFNAPVPWADFPSTVTDAQGRFVLEAEEAADMDGRRSNPEHLPSSTAVVVSHQGLRGLAERVPGSDWAVDMDDLVLLPGVVVVGRVLDKHSVPLEGADVRLPHMAWGDGRVTEAWTLLRDLIRTSSGPDGRFRLDTNWVGDFRFEVSLAGKQPWQGRKTLHLGKVADLGDVVLQTGGAVSGRVTDTTGEPLPDVRIKLRPQQFVQQWPGEDIALRDLRTTTRSSSGAREEETQSDEQGLFLFDALPPTSYRVYAMKEGFEPQVVGDVEPGALPLEVALLPEALIVLTLLDDLSGEAIVGAGATVRRRSTLTGPEQRFDMDPWLEILMGPAAAIRVGREGSGHGLVVAGPAGFLRNSVRTDSPEHAPLEVELPGVEPGQVLERTLRLNRAASIAGLVLDSSGEPLEHADVTVRPQKQDEDSGSFQGIGQKRVTTDADGRFHAGGLSGGLHLVEVDKGGFVIPDAIEFMLVDGEKSEGLEIVLQRGVILTGTVYKTDGQPAQNHEVNAQTEGVLQEDVASTKVLTDAAGRFVVDSLPPGELRVSAYPGAESFVRTAPDLAPDIVLQLRRPPSVRGRVYDADGHAVEADVNLHMDGLPFAAQETETNSDGQYLLEDLPVGESMLQARDGGARTPLVSVQLDYDRDEIVDLRFADGRILGQVLDEATGEPIPGVRMRAFVPNAPDRDFAGASDGTGRTNAEGRFVLQRLPPGTYVLTARHRDYIPFGPEGMVVGPAARVERTIRLSRSAVLTGRVTTVGAEGAGELGMTLIPIDGGKNQGFGGVPFEGDYRVSGLATGLYRYEVKRLSAYPPLPDQEHVFATGEVSVVQGEETRHDVVLVPKGG